MSAAEMGGVPLCLAMSNITATLTRRMWENGKCHRKAKTTTTKRLWIYIDLTHKQKKMGHREMSKYLNGKFAPRHFLTSPLYSSNRITEEKCTYSYELWVLKILKRTTKMSISIGGSIYRWMQHCQSLQFKSHVKIKHRNNYEGCPVSLLIVR